MVQKTRLIKLHYSGDCCQQRDIDWSRRTKMGFLKVLSYGLACLVALLAIGLGKYNFVLKRWQSVKKLHRSAFNAADFTVHQESEIPVTYYEPGKLGEVLKEV